MDNAHRLYWSFNQISLMIHIVPIPARADQAHISQYDPFRLPRRNAAIKQTGIGLSLVNFDHKVQPSVVVKI